MINTIARIFHQIQLFTVSSPGTMCHEENVRVYIYLEWLSPVDLYGSPAWLEEERQYCPPTWPTDRRSDGIDLPQSAWLNIPPCLSAAALVLP